MTSEPTPRLGDLARVFMRLGLTAFGGPAAHIGLMREEVVRRRGWLSDAEYLDLVGAANLVPGPTSTEVALHVGHRRAGVRGLLVAGFTFIGPSVVIAAVLAWVYVAYGDLPQAGALFAGVAPVVVAIVANAGLALGRTALRSWTTVVVFAGAVAASLAGVGELPILLIGGAVGLAVHLGTGVVQRAAVGLLAAPGASGPTVVAVAAAAGLASATPLAVFLVFLKIGALLFGSGYVLVAFLRSELVEGLGWITEQQLIDAVAVGQFTPGPVSSTATFIGFLVAGVPGAVAATLGIFLPAFVLVLGSAPLIARIRASGRARATLDGVNAAALGLLAVVAFELARGAITDPLTLAVAIVAFVLLALDRIGPAWLILLGAGIGLLAEAAGP